jgi:5'-nucleotidase / UDP-sugar diphosphatase
LRRFVLSGLLMMLMWWVAVMPGQAATVTLLFTNDFESAYDPTPAFWRDDMSHIGGIAELATLINQIRAKEPNVFLFDAGDIFTGTLAKLTKGAVSFELMMSMGYDALVVGNHEFEYGWQTFAQQKNRVAFPVLGANLFYQGTQHPYAIIERHGVRIGVIGVLGQDAATALVPANIAGVDVLDPTSVVRRYVDFLRPQVDLVVVLTHQGQTAPMQTDDEADPRVYRGNAENLALAGAVPGIDVIFAGHTDAGTREPLVHPINGTLIMQTFGQGQHLGYLQIELDAQKGRAGHHGKLIAVDSRALAAEPRVAAKLARYRAQHAQIFKPVGITEVPLVRRYYEESDLGNLFADITARAMRVDIGLMPSGALRKDLPGGVVKRVDLLDTFPFEDRLAVVEVSGAVLLDILEQGLSLERGLLQVSGLQVVYDPQRPVGERLMEAYIAEVPLQPDELYTLATLEILAQGGDAYVQFRKASAVAISELTFAQALEDYFAETPLVKRPPAGRLIPR